MGRTWFILHFTHISGEGEEMLDDSRRKRAATVVAVGKPIKKGQRDCRCFINC